MNSISIFFVASKSLRDHLLLIRNDAIDEKYVENEEIWNESFNVVKKEKILAFQLNFQL